MLDEESIEQAIARMADGSLAPAQRRHVEHEVRERGLQEELERQRWVASLLREATEPAPQRLRKRIALLTAPSPRRRRAPLLAGLAAAALAAAIVAPLLLASRQGESLSVAEAAALALRRPTTAAPAVDAADARLLALAVDGLHFPNWESQSWSAVGTRIDSSRGQRFLTVSYRNRGGERVAYSIASTGKLAHSTGARVTQYGTAYDVLRIDGATVVTWVRDGHACVVASRQAGTSALLALASERSTLNARARGAAR